MENKLKKMWPLATLALLSSASLVQAQCVPDNGMTNKSVNPSARGTVGNGFFASIEPFVWKAHEDGLTPTITNTDGAAVPSGASNYYDAKFDHMHFKWDWGFHLGLGVNLAHDEWDTLLNWTHYRTTASQETDCCENGPSATTIYPQFFAQQPASTNDQPVVTNSNAKWKLRLDMVDWELGRKFYTGRWLSLRPFMGLRGAWIRQKMDIDYSGGDVATDQFYDVDMKNHFWGVGPRIGLNTQWNFSKEFSFYGDGAISLLYGRFKVTQEEEVGADTKLDISDNWRTSRFVTDLAVGIRYEHLFEDKEFKFTGSFGWEHHMFFDQNNFKHFVTNATMGDVMTWTIPDWDGNNLSTQGWTLSLRFDF